MWILLALMSALMAGVSAVVAKVGLKNVDSSAGFAVQSVVIMLLAWLFVSVTGGSHSLARLEAKDWGFLALSGLISTIAYLFYFAAVKAGNVSRVAPLDSLSLVFSIVFAVLFISEKLTPPVVLGASLMAAGALVIAVFGGSSGG